MPRFFGLLLIAPAAWLFFVQSALGQALQLDQINPPILQVGGRHGLLATSEYVPAQVITAGRSGPLSRVDLPISRFPSVTSPLTIQIARTSNAAPDFSPAGLLASHVVAAETIDTLGSDEPSFNVSVDFGASAPTVTADQMLAIIVRVEGTSMGYTWHGAAGIDAYTRGGAFTYHNDSGRVVAHPFMRQYFRTFVGIPEPSPALPLATAGVFSAALARHRQRRR